MWMDAQSIRGSTLLTGQAAPGARLGRCRGRCSFRQPPLAPPAGWMSTSAVRRTTTHPASTRCTPEVQHPGARISNPLDQLIGLHLVESGAAFLVDAGTAILGRLGLGGRLGLLLDDGLRWCLLHDRIGHARLRKLGAQLLGALVCGGRRGPPPPPRPPPPNPPPPPTGGGPG